jgi:replicative DNA helicase
LCCRKDDAGGSEIGNPALSNVSLATHLNKAKLFELMAEDDASLIELAEGGTIAGLTLDDIEKMTRNELRAALRESRAEHKADDLLDETTKKYRQLQNKQARIAPRRPMQWQELRAELTKLFADAEGSIRGTIRQG